MGRRSVYCGDSGNGLAAKICNKFVSLYLVLDGLLTLHLSLLLGISMAGTAEAMLLGKSLGLSPELLASILNTSVSLSVSHPVHLLTAVACTDWKMLE